MAEITYALRREVALADEVLPYGTRLRGLWLGKTDEVRISTPLLERALAHTHPSGILQFSQADIATLQKLGQTNSTLIAPSGKWVTLPVPTPF